ncbi:hypothetical protein B0H12DRAFT_1008347 [Mycena haematopus]|nr:hypothetical protein B0H12DRAFT_1008347 [Mycena haematopus]
MQSVSKTAKAPPNPPKTRRARASSPLIVPSSVPHQDLPPEDVAPVKRKATRTKSTAAKRVRKKLVVSASSRVRNKNPINYKESSDEELLSQSEREEEVTTEPADDEEYVTGGPSRKRKRGIKVETPSEQLKPRRGGKAPASTRQVKRARAASGSNNGEEATRVFALWRQDGSYYSGVVHSQAHSQATGQARYTVHFDDDTKDEVRLDQMRLCTLKVGDSAFIPNSNRAVEITDVDADEETVTVRSEGHQVEVHISKLRIAARTISSGWDDRLVTSVVCQVKPLRSSANPTSRFSVSSTTSSRRATSDLFSRIGFCITHNSEAASEKEAMSVRIRNYGGVVIDDWECMLEMKGKRTARQWTLTDSDAVPTETLKALDCVFLLAEDPTHTPKYLIALALGIPCLQMDFIQHAIDTNTLADWTMYLLPSGFSDFYASRVSQFIIADWGDGRDDLKNIMNNRVAFKAFKGKKILCVSRGVLDDNDVSAALPKIMLAMGATSVEAVREIGRATLKLTKYDYIVNRDTEIKASKLRDCTVVSWDWVKDALISRCMPPIN